MLNGKARSIIGVMPPRFQAVGSDVYMPISWTRPDPQRDRFDWDVDDPVYFWATGIVKRGVSLETAAADIDVIARQTARMHPDDYPKKFRALMKPLNDVVLGSFKMTMLLLCAAVGMLLFISCSNVAGLLLAHASARTREISLRAALGASRPRLFQQLLSESLVLAVAGCALGCVIAYVGLKAFMMTNLAPLPWEAEIAVNRPVLAFAAGISLLSALFCGLAPALHAVRGDLQKGLASSGVNVNPVFQHSRFRSGLVIGQVALSLLLLTCAGLVTRSFLTLIHIDLGSSRNRSSLLKFIFRAANTPRPMTRRPFFERLLPQLSAMPGVSRATELIGLPLLLAPQGDVTIPGKPHHEQWTTRIEMCSEDYFPTLGQHLLQGRLLTADDMAGGHKVAVVNQSLVRKFFDGKSPIGRVIKFNVLDEIPDTPHDTYFEIVGVVNDTRGFDFEGDTAIPRPADKAVPSAFIPYSISGFGNRAIALRAPIPPVFLANQVRQLIWSLDHDVVLVEPHAGSGVGFSLDQLMQGLVYGKQEFAAMAFGACAFLGFVLALIGLFSVMTYIVSLETHDIGIRLALGAPHVAILRMVLERGMRLILIGVGIGVVVSLLITRFLSSQFRGISPRDPVTLALVIAAILTAGLSACLLPTRRAVRVDPMVTLRYE